MSVIMVHGGVETSTAPPYIKVLRESALAGLNALSSGHLKAAEEAVRVLENSPLFNAGYGSVLNLDGQVEMDASVMDGETGRFGAVAAVRDVSNPVSVACRVLEETPHVLLAGDGAIKFARSRGFPPANCVTPEMMEMWRKAVSLAGRGEAAGVNLFTGMPEERGQACDTVGCVVSHRGRLAAASSTGGSFLKLPGRVGDTPVIGGGIFASRRCAVVCTGLGEAFIETLTAKYVDSLIAHGRHPQEAAEKAMVRLAGSRRAPGGIIVADSRGRWGSAYNTRTFPVALVVDGKLVEDFTPRKIQGWKSSLPKGPTP
ncbi:MAG: isoaspartyl peptidase/L-asparaginase [Peptococcaceae bacterium]|nr:isoaspartyl peptidase/L-asparaginase [Peptococcaceae bacterium]